MILDTSGLLSALFGNQRRHAECSEALLGAPGRLVLSPFILAELDYMVGKLAGVDAQLALLDQVSSGAYELATFSAHEVGLSREIAARHRDPAVGIADASIIILARRLSDHDVLTLDERHFRVLSREYPLRIWPADA